MSDSVGLYDVRSVHVHDVGERWPGRRATDPEQPTATPASTATATAATTTATASATATAAVGVPAGPERQTQSADGREAVEDHRRPEHFISGQLDQVGRTGNPQVSGLTDQEVRRAQPV